MASCEFGFVEKPAVAADGKEDDRRDRQEDPGVFEQAQARALEHGAQTFVERIERRVERIGRDLSPKDACSGFVEFFAVANAGNGLVEGVAVGGLRGLSDEQRGVAAVLAFKLRVDVAAWLVTGNGGLVNHIGRSRVQKIWKFTSHQ